MLHRVFSWLILSAAWTGCTNQDTAPDVIGLTTDWKTMTSVNHFFALSNPALESALSKKSFSSVNYPILAWSVFTSTDGSEDLPPSKTSTAWSLSCFFHWVIWFGCTSNCCDSSAKVLSPTSAAIATLALNVAECFRLVLFAIFCSMFMTTWSFKR
jgi:hypothetical protein